MNTDMIITACIEASRSLNTSVLSDALAGAGGDRSVEELASAFVFGELRDNPNQAHDALINKFNRDLVLQAVVYSSERASCLKIAEANCMVSAPRGDEPPAKDCPPCIRRRDSKAASRVSFSDLREAMPKTMYARRSWVLTSFSFFRELFIFRGHERELVASWEIITLGERDLLRDARNFDLGGFSYAHLPCRSILDMGDGTWYYTGLVVAGDMDSITLAPGMMPGIHLISASGYIFARDGTLYIIDTGKAVESIEDIRRL